MTEQLGHFDFFAGGGIVDGGRWGKPAMNS